MSPAPNNLKPCNAAGEHLRSDGIRGAEHAQATQPCQPPSPRLGQQSSANDATGISGPSDCLKVALKRWMQHKGDGVHPVRTTDEKLEQYKELSKAILRAQKQRADAAEMQVVYEREAAAAAEARVRHLTQELQAARDWVDSVTELTMQQTSECQANEKLSEEQQELLVAAHKQLEELEAKAEQDAERSAEEVAALQAQLQQAQGELAAAVVDAQRAERLGFRLAAAERDRSRAEQGQAALLQELHA